MPVHRTFLSLVLLGTFCPVLHGEDFKLTGYVTDAGTSASFQLNGYTVLCDGATQFSVERGGRAFSSATCPQHTIGEELTVTGIRDRHTDTVRAATVSQVAYKEGSVSGTGLILHVLSPDRQGHATIAADGYVLDVDPQTEVVVQTGEPPSTSPFRQNVWIQYRGVLRSTGRVHVTSARLWLNVVAPAEAKLRKAADFDPTQVTQNERQSSFSRHFGVDPKRMPAHADPALQGRVDALAARLVPEIQRQLPDTDPLKIQFRFQLVDEKKYAYFATPDGVILLAYEAAAQQPSDDQLAALMALGMADVLQKQEFRSRSKLEVADSLALFGAGGLLVGMQVRDHIEQTLTEQYLRVALELLHDAGFNICSAPEMVWRFNRKEGHALSQTPLSPSAQYMYRSLNRLWEQPGGFEATSGVCMTSAVTEAFSAKAP